MGILGFATGIITKGWLVGIIIGSFVALIVMAVMDNNKWAFIPFILGCVFSGYLYWQTMGIRMVADIGSSMMEDSELQEYTQPQEYAQPQSPYIV
jgi:cobalamin biosynthesis protein CobD/CbiB